MSKLMRSNPGINTAIAVLCALGGCSKDADKPSASSGPASPKLVVASWGGAYQEAQRKAFFEPFTRETGVQIVEEATPDYGKFYEWQRAGKASVDVADVETYFVFQAAEKDALLPIDSKLVSTADLIKGATHPNGVASCAYADVIAWNRQRHLDWDIVSWRQFWNIEKYPGARGLRDLPASTLEAALLGSGTDRHTLYPLTVDKAFKALSELRSKAKIALWTSGSQPIEWLLGGSVEMAMVWNGRVYDAQKEGKPIAMTFENGMIDWLWWVVPAHAKNSELAMKFIAFTLRADRQAELARCIPYGPTNHKALSLLESEVLHRLPTSPENIGKLIVRDNAWWAKNDDSVQPRWREWKLRIKAP